MSTPDDNTLSNLRRLLTEPGATPTAEEVAQLDEAFPYLTLPAALRLSRAADRLDPQERKALISRVAVGAPGSDALFKLLDPDGSLLTDFMPAEEPQAPTASDTDSAIDTFLSTYGRMSEREEALLEKMIFNPVPDDYAALLAREEAEGGGEETPVVEETAAPEPDSQDSRLEAFLASSQAAEPSQPQPPHPSPSPKPENSEGFVPAATSSLSESLAQVYIRRGRYDKAYDIIHALSLNNPKKSVYFADQLRFLQKLMLLERYQSASHGEA